MIFNYDDDMRVWYCTECDEEVDHGFLPRCPRCGTYNKEF